MMLLIFLEIQRVTVRTLRINEEGNGEFPFTLLSIVKKPSN